MRARALAAAVGAAAVWLLAAHLLWRSSVPATLRLPHVDAAALFTRSQLDAAASFGRVVDLLACGSLLAELAALAVYARYGMRWARESAAGPVGTGLLLGMLGFALVWAVDLPFGVLELWWERRHALVSTGYLRYVFGDWLALGGRFVVLCLALAIVMALGRLLGRWWWLAAAPALAGLVALSAFVSPYLVSTRPLADPQLAAAARRLERVEGVSGVPVVVQDVRSTTSLPNAEAMGIGPSRRIVLWDTLTSGPFSERQLEVVVAHEIGHVAHRHIAKEIAWFLLFAFPAGWAVELVTRRRGGVHRAEAIPLALLAFVVAGLVLQPAKNAVSRHLEAEADWSALRATRDPAAAEGLFRRFVPTTLDRPSPPALDYVLFETHPTILQRIALARAWAAERRR